MRAPKLAFFFFVVLAGYSFATGQSDEGRKSADDSSIPKYRNDTLGMEMSLPKGWYISETRELEELAGNARKELKKEHRLTNERIVHQAKVEIIAFGMSKRPLGTTKNAAFGLSVTKQPSEVITSKIVADATKAFFLKNTEYSLAKDISIQKIDGFQFATFDMDVASSLGKQHVRVLIVCIKSEAITFALTYWDDHRDLETMMMAVESVRFSTR